MEYLSTSTIAKKWNISERCVRYYCKSNRIAGAILVDKKWIIPSTASKPLRKKRENEKNTTLLDVLKREKNSSISGGIYHKLQIEMTYNSNHIEGSCLTHDQTKYIFETNTIGVFDKSIDVDDIIETANHFRCIDFVIDNAKYLLTEKMIKELHYILKNGTSDSRKSYFAIGNYKKLPNEVGGIETTLPENVDKEMKLLINNYNQKKEKTFEDLIEFHYCFERIHPFYDGNGRVGRLILLKECLHYNIVPFIINEEIKMFYYRGLVMWKEERGYLIDTCLTTQDNFKLYLDYFRINYPK